MKIADHDLVVNSFTKGDTTTRVTLNPAYLFLRDELRRLPRLWADDEGETIFEGRNTVRVMEMAGIKLAVKRFRRLSAPRRAVYTYIRPCKAMRGLIYSLEYLRRGVPTPEGVAAVEVMEGQLLDDSYLVTRLSDGHELFPELVMAERYDPEVAMMVAEFMLDMHRRGVINKDPNLKNLLSSDPAPDGSRRFEAIDINRSIFTDKNFPRTRIVKNLSRVTHRRALLMLIVERYAMMAKMPVKPLIDDVMNALDDLERGRSFRHRLKAIFLNK